MPPPAPAPGRTARPPSVSVAHSRRAVSSASRASRSAPLPRREPVRRARVPHQRGVGRGGRHQLETGQLVAVPVERGDQATAAVGRGGAPHPDDDAVHAGGRRGQQQLAHAVRRGSDRVACLGRDQVQADRLGRLDVGRVADLQHPRRHRVAQRTADGDDADLAAERGAEHVDEAGSAVGERQQVQLVVGRAAQPAERDRVGRLRRREVDPEPVGRHQDLHPRILPHLRRERSEAGRAPDGEPAGEVRLDRQVGAERGAHLQLERVVALLGPSSGANG